jgi:hypothetical protein
MSATTDTIVSRQWSSRPADERFTSLTALAAYTSYRRTHSRSVKLANRQLTILPNAADRLDVAVTGPNGHPAQFTHWSFAQLSSLAGVPAGYLRSGLPGDLIADNLNWGLHYGRQTEDIGVLLRRTVEDNTTTLAAATGPTYGRIWDAEICHELVQHYGDGVTGDWRVPGEFGTALPEITAANTTLYGSDRDMWVFLADETNRVTIANRRDGSAGSLARGFYISNSEVGAATLTLGMFLFDYACCNRILWGVSERAEIKIRHTSGAPFRFSEEVLPVLSQLARRDISARPISDTIAAAQSTKLTGDIDRFLTERFARYGKHVPAGIVAAHLAEEHRPIETVWDAVTGVTAYAKLIPWQDDRVALERTAGALLRPLAVH